MSLMMELKIDFNNLKKQLKLLENKKNYKYLKI
jgi:hypothetical protein